MSATGRPKRELAPPRGDGAQRQGGSLHTGTHGATESFA